MRVRSLQVVLIALTLIAAACAPAADDTGDQETTEQTATDQETTTTEEEPAEEEEEPAEEEAGEPIRIGVLAPLTGFMSGDGPTLVEGFELYWDLNGREVAGRPIDIIVEDTATDPEVAVNKARLLVEQRNVDMLIGEVLAPSGIAVAEYVKRETDIPYLIPIIGADDLTQRDSHPQILRVAGGAASQFNHPVGKWAADQGHQTAVTLGSDFNFGHQTVGGFVNVFTDEGGEILDQFWTPLGTQDYGPFIPDIQNLNPDALFVNLAGGDGLRFFEAWVNFGMDDTGIALIPGEQTLEQAVLESLGEDVEGRLAATRYPMGRDAPATQEFVDAYMDAYGKLPNETAGAMYIAARWIDQALQAIEGDISDIDRLVEAVRSVEFEETVKGPMSMDEFGGTVINVYIARIERRDDGQLWHVPVETFENVSQFWTYDPEEFLDHPVYSREYQGDGVWPEPNPGS